MFMTSFTSFCRRGFAGGVMVVALVLIAGRSARAQGAWVGDPKTLEATFSYEYVPSSQIVSTPDKNIPDRPTQNHVITIGAEYVPIENLAIEATVPMAAVEYTGTMKHLPPGKWDDGSFHETLQDFRLGARYQLLHEWYVALTPFVALSVPMMNYENNGFATGGRHLKAAHLGASVGRTLEPFLPNLYITATYELTLAESYDINADTAGISQTRSDFDGQIGYLLLDGKLNINAAGNYRRQHHGIEFEDFGNLSPNLTLNHDPILKEKYLFLGGGVSYAISHKFTIAANVRFFIQGYNTRDQSLYGLELIWNVL